MDAFRESAPRRRARQAVTIARAVRAARARVRAAPSRAPVDGEALRSLLAEAAADARLVEVPADRPPWTPTRVAVAAGDRLTWLAWGEAGLVRPLGLALPAELSLGLRVRSGEIVQGSRPTGTLTAARSGDVEVASLYPAEPRPGGGLARDRLPHRVMSGALQAVVARWPADADPQEALRALAQRDPSGLCAAEADRLAAAPAPPAGWDHHPQLAPSEVYAATSEGIALDVRRTVGIVRHPLDDVALTAGLRLRWSWRLDQLPSSLPEDTTLTHDYLSVALEFDDGQDLTWHWSSSLPVGFAYPCPLEHWRHRETHVVARSGTADVGRWVDEERRVLADHRGAIGGAPPARVVAAWLIAVSVFQGGRGRGEVRRLELVDGERVVPVI